MEILGIDIGGSGIKSAIIDTTTGDFLTKRERTKTPSGADPELLLEVLAKHIGDRDWKGPVGIGFPGVMRDSRIYTAANLDKSLIGLDLGKAIYEKCGNPAYALNDADAAGYAEMRLGSGRGVRGVAIMITVGTGIGTAVFTNGVLVPNTEFGHIVMNGKAAELQVADRIRESEDLSWKQWGKRFDEYLRYLEMLFSPERFIIGGGGGKKPEKYREYLTIETELEGATFKNKAGIIGAALFAAENSESQ